MDAEKLNQALYDKMAAEQERFKHGLLGMTVEEALPMNTPCGRTFS